MMSEDARLGHDPPPIAASVPLEALVRRFAGGDAGAVFFASGGQVNDVGRGDGAADGEEAFVLREEGVEVGHFWGLGWVLVVGMLWCCGVGVRGNGNECKGGCGVGKVGCCLAGVVR